MISIPSFAKINLGLKIGSLRPDSFHELRTIYQTLALHDTIRVDVQPGSGIEIRCNDPRVPLDQWNTCYQIVERVLALLGSEDAGDRAGKQVPHGPKPTPEDNKKRAAIGAARAGPLQNQVSGATEAVPLQTRSREISIAGKVVIEIEKRLPVQGGMGAASSNGVATMLGLERALGVQIAMADKLRIAAEVGSDLPLFLVGGTVLGVGRGEEVYPLPDLPSLHVVVVTPPIGVSTPKAFSRWDELRAKLALTDGGATGTINEFGQRLVAWLSASYPQAVPASGVPAVGGDRAETPLLDLVRAGIENDFEGVVFPEYPELREVKELLQREGALYAALSGSGSTLYGLFVSAEQARAAAERMRAAGHAAVETTTLEREEYWQAMEATSFEPRASG